MPARMVTWSHSCSQRERRSAAKGGVKSRDVVTAEANRENVTVTARQSMSGCSPTRLAASETLTPEQMAATQGSCR
jgi:hypothetical protein